MNVNHLRVELSVNGQVIILTRIPTSPLTIESIQDEAGKMIDDAMRSFGLIEVTREEMKKNETN